MTVQDAAKRLDLSIPRMFAPSVQPIAVPMLSCRRGTTEKKTGFVARLETWIG
jgi:hypothetical protein